MSMAVSDVVVGNLTSIYLVAMGVVKACGFASGRSFDVAFLLIAASALVGLILIGALTWDVSSKAKHAVLRDHVHEMCKGGICWHGVAVKYPASQVRFRLPPQQQQNGSWQH